MPFQGSCHCGRIAYEVDADNIPSAIECNCSICRRKGSLLWFVPKSRFHLKTPEENAATYRFNTMKIAHRFCTVCGMHPYADGQDKDGNPMAAVNVRCLEGVDLSELKVIQYDGLHH